MKPLPYEQYDKKPRHNAYSGSTLRARVYRIYLPAPVAAQARAEMQTGLSPRVQSDPLGALYKYVMEVSAATRDRRGGCGDPLHDRLQGIRSMVR